MKNNIPPSIKDKISAQLYLKKDHPIEIIKNLIFGYFFDFDCLIELDPFSKVEHCFDELLIPKNHVSRKPSDTFYKDENHVLRTHMTALMYPLVKERGYKKYVVCGDVYRKDEIDSSHYPVFHQIDGFSIVNKNKNPQTELKKVLSDLIETLFPGNKYRFKDSIEYDNWIKENLTDEEYIKEKFDPETEFPFTHSSTEIEVLFNINGKDKWVEILGGGVVRDEIMNNMGLKNKKAWAFGCGLERIAMIKYSIPDIRYFWEDDERFIKQFKNGVDTKFKLYSKLPAVTKDMSMWVPNNFTENDFLDLVRDTCNYIESVELIDEFIHPIKKSNISKCYRFKYRKFDKNLTNNEVNKIHKIISKTVEKKLKVKIRGSEKII